MALEMLSLKVPITAMAFNADCSQLAVALADTNVEIYQNENKKWNKTHTFTDHTSRVTGIDWAPNTNRIVTASADRNAYVWEMKDGSWQPMLVLLRIPRAATTVKWSPKEDKFAVGSSARLATVCYYEPTKAFAWVSRHIKKPIRSTVSCLSWHPNNIILAVGSTDTTCRIYSAYVRDIEDKPEPNEWGSKLPFSTLLAEFKLSAWCSGLCFSPSGTQLAIVAHNSSISVATAGEDQLTTHYGKQLPFTCVEWVSGNQLVAAGHDRSVFAFSTAGGITCQGYHCGKKASTGGISAADKFRGLDSRGATERASIPTAHIAPICDLKITVGQRGNVQAFATASGDGKIFFWPWKKAIAGSMSK